VGLGRVGSRLCIRALGSSEWLLVASTLAFFSGGCECGGVLEVVFCISKAANRNQVVRVENASMASIYIYMYCDTVYINPDLVDSR
jgi:hypothetical protein